MDSQVHKDLYLFEIKQDSGMSFSPYVQQLWWKLRRKKDTKDSIMKTQSDGKLQVIQSASYLEMDILDKEGEKHCTIVWVESIGT